MKKKIPCGSKNRFIVLPVLWVDEVQHSSENLSGAGTLSPASHLAGSLCLWLVIGQ